MATSQQLLDELSDLVEYYQAYATGEVLTATYSFDTTTTDADPGAGKIRFNNATPASATEIYIDLTDTYTADLTSFIDSWGTTGSAGKRGILQLRRIDLNRPQIRMFFMITEVVNATGYRKLTVQHLGSDSTFSANDLVSIVFTPAGPDGKSYLASSTTSLSMTVASKSFTTQTNLAYVVGSRVRLARASAPATFMEGVVTAYNINTGAMSVSVDYVSTTGTFTDWNISITGEGATAATNAAAAATSATNAAGSATAASTSASNAATSATNAANSATSAANALASFLTSPAFQGTPTAPTPTAGTNTVQIATTAFVAAAVAALGIAGPSNTSMGTNSLLNNTTATGITALGSGALRQNTTAVAALGTITGGSGYTNGTYNGVQLSYVSGPTAAAYPTANITVAGGVVTAVTIVGRGRGFTATGTVLTASAASIGGTGSGFSVPVSTIQTAVNNSAVGANSLGANTIGQSNTAVGVASLQLNTEGSSNSAFGLGALYGNLIGSNNTAIGTSALYSNTASNNTAVGAVALYGNTTGTYNNAFGYYALSAVTTGNNNVAMGGEAMVRNVSGSSNVGIGTGAVFKNTTGGQNIGIGRNALYTVSTGVATLGTIVPGSGYTNGTYNNVQMSLVSGSTMSTYPTANVTVAGGVVTTVTLVTQGNEAKDTTTVLTVAAALIGGTGSGFSVPVASLTTAPSNNIGIGDSAGSLLTNGVQNNILIGNNAQADSNTGSNQINIGGVYFQDRIVPAGHVLEQRNGANPQAFRVYNTFTDASNFERGSIRWVTNHLTIGVESLGTGNNSRNLHLVSGIGGGQVSAIVGNGHVFTLENSNNGARFAGANPIGFTTGASNDSAADVQLWRDGASDVLALRRGTNAQSLRVYNTFTDASNYERGEFRWSSNVLQIGTFFTGSGASRALQFVVGNTSVFNIATTGHTLWNTDNTFDIGASGATRPRSIYAGTDIHAASRFLRNSGGSYSSTLDNSGLALAGPSGGPPVVRLTQSGFVDFSFGPMVSSTAIQHSGASSHEFFNGATAQRLSVYNTRTDASNYERLDLSWSASVCLVETAGIGTGIQRPLAIGGSDIRLRTGAVTRWQVNAAGHFIGALDNTYDIGQSGASRPRHGYFGGSLFAGFGSFASGTVTANAPVIDITQTWNNAAVAFTALRVNVTDTASLSGLSGTNLIDLQVGGASRFRVAKDGGVWLQNTITVPAGSSIQWSGRGDIFAAANGVFGIRNATANDFDRIWFGGSTNLFPALKRVGTGLEARLADDSAYAPFTVSQLQIGHASDTPVTRVAAGRIAVAGNELARETPRLSTETAGVLTSASAGCMVVCTGNITLNANVFSAENLIGFDAGAANRTFTSGAGVTMYLRGSIVTSATLNANRRGGVSWRSATVCILLGGGWA